MRSQCRRTRWGSKQIVVFLETNLGFMWFDEQRWCKLVEEWCVWLFCKRTVIDHYSFWNTVDRKIVIVRKDVCMMIWWKIVMSVGCRMTCVIVLQRNGDGSLFILRDTVNHLGENSDCSYDVIWWARCKLVVEWRVWLFCKGMVMDHYSFIENS